MAQKERSTRESHPLILSFVKKFAIKSGTSVGRLNIILAPGDGNLNECPGSFRGGGGGGGVEAFELIDA